MTFNSGRRSWLAAAPDLSVEDRPLPGGSTEGRRVPDAPDLLPGGHGPGGTDHQ